MDQAEPKHSLFEFVDEISPLAHPLLYFRQRFNSWTGNSPVWSPIVYREHKRTPSLMEKGEIIGVAEATLQAALQYHDHRLALRQKVRNFFLIIFLLSISILWFVLDRYYGLVAQVRDFWESLGQITGIEVATAFLLTIFISGYFLYFFVGILCYKLSTILADRHFADTLCVRCVLDITLQLSRQDVLSRSDARRILHRRLGVMVRNLSLLAQRYGSRSEINRVWAQQHFGKFALFIGERERWVISPLPSSLQDLRRDFNQLQSNLILGHYGEFNWNSVATISEVASIPLAQKVLTKLIRLLGIVLPLLIMAYLLAKPEVIERLNINPNILALVFIAWLLLAIDTALKLGFVAGVINLAKEFRQLK
jgi:hypothetical protein